MRPWAVWLVTHRMRYILYLIVAILYPFAVVADTVIKINLSEVWSDFKDDIKRIMDYEL